MASGSQWALGKRGSHSNVLGSQVHDLTRSRGGSSSTAAVRRSSTTRSEVQPQTRTKTQAKSAVKKAPTKSTAKVAAKKVAAKKAPAKSTVNPALNDWVNMYCVAEYLPQLQKLGVKTVHDFKELSESDIKSLKMNRFDEKRFMQGLRLSVPEFLIYSKSSNEVTGKVQRNEGGEVEQWLEKHQLSDYMAKLTKLGVRVMDDIRAMDDGDVRGMKLNKFDNKRFLKALESLRKPQAPAFQAKQFTGNGASRMTFEQAMLRGNPVSVSMSNASQMAREACLKGSLGTQQEAKTRNSFHDQWKATQAFRKKQVLFARDGSLGQMGALDGNRNMFHTWSAMHAQY